MDEMVSLTKAQVPHYLVGTEFHNSLSADDEEEFRIPRKFIKPNVNVSTGAELAHLFHTMKFWGMMKLPDDILELLVLKSKVIPDREAGPIRDVLREFDVEFKLLQLFETLPRCSSKKERLNSAVESGREDVMELVIRVDGQINVVLIKAIAEHGFLHLLQSVTRSFWPIKPGTTPLDKVSVAVVASRGHAECLLYLFQNGCKKEKNTCRAAAENGHLACLQIAREHGCAWNTAIADVAAKNGHLDCLIYAMEQSGLDKAADAACAAAEGGQVECLQYILDQGVTPTRRMCYSACERNSLDCLQLLHARGAPWDVVCARKAAERGSLLCLQYLIEEGCKVDSKVSLLAAERGRDQILEVLLAAHCEVGPECVDVAAQRGHLSCVKVLKKFDVHLDEHRMDFTVQYCCYNPTKYVRTLFEAGYKIPPCVLVSAARHGATECVEYICVNRCCELTAQAVVAATTTTRCEALLAILHQHGCPWDTRVCAELARHNDITGLKFAHENGCPWDAATVTAAIRSRSLEYLEYVLSNECPVSGDVCELAASLGACDLLRCLHKHGCELTLATCVAAAAHKSLDCLEYAVEHGAPVDESICAAAVTDSDLYDDLYESDSEEEDRVTSGLSLGRNHHHRSYQMQQLGVSGLCPRW